MEVATFDLPFPIAPPSSPPSSSDFISDLWDLKVELAKPSNQNDLISPSFDGICSSFSKTESAFAGIFGCDDKSAGVDSIILCEEL